MATNTSPQNDVLQSKNHSTLSAEEIAKAVARHTKNHSAAKERILPRKRTKARRSKSYEVTSGNKDRFTFAAFA